MLEWIPWESFEFERASLISRYSFPDSCAFNSRSYYVFYAQPDFVSPWDNTEVVLTLHDSSFPLAQCTGPEAGDPFEGVTRFSVVDTFFELKDILDEVHDLVEMPLEGSRDVFIYEESTSLGCNNVLPNLLDHSHVSPICSLPSPPPKYYIDTPILLCLVRLIMI